jgi:hypothetical protein
MATQTIAKSTIGSYNLLRLALRADGIFEGIVGAGLLLGAGAAASFLGLDTALVAGLGGVMLAACIALVWLSGQPWVNRQTGYAVALANDAWVVFSVLALVLNWLPFTEGGKWAFGIMALLVADFALVQFYAARRAR